jgi:methyl-CpG-binding domain protein 2
VKTQDSKVKTDLKIGTHEKPEKPKQLFWEKRLENFTACDSDGSEFSAIQLPKQLKPVGPEIKEQTLFQSIATALHSTTHPVTGQTSSKTALSTNPGVFIDPEQPLMYQILVSDEDIKRQQDRVDLARKRLQEALKA